MCTNCEHESTEEPEEESQPAIVCAECSDEIADADDVRGHCGDGRALCGACSQECDGCDRVYAESDEWTIATINRYGSRGSRTRTICEDCRDSGPYFQCEDCNEWFHNDLSCGCNTRGSTVCESCSESYSTCDGCGETFCSDHGYATDDGYYCCRECAPADDDDEEVIESYGYTRAVRFFGSGPVYYGIELEVERSDYSSCDREGVVESAQECLDILDSEFICCKHDGSLLDGGQGGFEIVTQPASYAEQQARWGKFFDKLPKNLQSYRGGRCGLHIHVSRKPLSQLAIGKMLAFVNCSTNAALIRKIAGRTSQDYARLDPAKKISDAAKCPRSRYEAINLNNSQTVEFRIFRGTLKRESFLRALEFVQALVQFALPGRNSIVEFVGHEAFCRYVLKNRKVWPNLAKLIDDYLDQA